MTASPRRRVRHDVDVTLFTCSVDSETPAPGAVDFRALAWRPSLNGGAPSWVVPPLVEIVDYLEEEEFSAVHTDSAAGQGLVALAAARLLHLPVTGAVDPERLTAPRGPGDLAGRLRRRYRRVVLRQARRGLRADSRDGAGARGRRGRAESHHRAAGAVRGRGRPRPGLSPAGATRARRIPVVAPARPRCRPATRHSESASRA